VLMRRSLLVLPCASSKSEMERFCGTEEGEVALVEAVDEGESKDLGEVLLPAFPLPRSDGDWGPLSGLSLNSALASVIVALIPFDGSEALSEWTGGSKAIDMGSLCRYELLTVQWQQRSY
jgi:hypothetical protein